MHLIFPTYSFLCHYYSRWLIITCDLVILSCFISKNHTELIKSFPSDIDHNTSYLWFNDFVPRFVTFGSANVWVYALFSDCFSSNYISNFTSSNVSGMRCNECLLQFKCHTSASLMCCSTQALHRELIGQRQDVDGTLNQVCLSLAVQPTTMEVQSSTETAAGERLFLNVLHPPRGTLYLFFQRFFFYCTEVLSYVSYQLTHDCGQKS